MATFPPKPLFLSLLHFLSLFLHFHPSSSASNSSLLNCTDTTRTCNSFLAFRPPLSLIPTQTLALIESMFDALPKDISVDQAPTSDNHQLFYIKKNCSCDPRRHEYLAMTTFTVPKNEGTVYEQVSEAYGGLAVLANNGRPAREGAVVGLRLACGCSGGVWNYLLSYTLMEDDTLEGLSSRFGAGMGDIEMVNGIDDPSVLTVGRVYYIPMNSVPGEPYSMLTNASPAPSPSVITSSVVFQRRSSHFPLGWALAIMGIGLILVLAIILICISFKLLTCHSEIQAGSEKEIDSKDSHKLPILRRTSFCYPSGRYLCCRTEKLAAGAASHRQLNIPKDMMNDVFDMEKPVVFTYEEILTSTEAFADSNLLGHGTYGSVYYGVLRDQEVAIKRMTATKTKEFMAEMKVLCKVHHSNLVELIGYAASDDELFLVYEYAHKSSLRSRLHDPQNKGYASLSWIARVQIALDAARGLEYIHEHTKAHYVHRDIKTSNILLDNSFRAKISDFGLAKLVGRTNEGEASVTRIVGTLGYLAPEYLSDGQATRKSDVYAFGVVLFELISGRDAITRTEGTASVAVERRSLVAVMLGALRNSPSSMSMVSLKDCIDPNLMDLYPHDCVYKMAMLAKQCVDEDPILRPDMKQVVISLSQILLSSVEWEATLAGNSQVFSGLVQGR
ncbi:hypothetical protein AMTRI_Chr05g58220 [Amborella trichopoda]